jgi:hypothetical protein
MPSASAMKGKRLGSNRINGRARCNDPDAVRRIGSFGPAWVRRENLGWGDPHRRFLDVLAWVERARELGREPTRFGVVGPSLEVWSYYMPRLQPIAEVVPSGVPRTRNTGIGIGYSTTGQIEDQLEPAGT